MITTFTGQAAEEIVAEYLREKGWKIIEQNWRRRRAEIDVVAEKAKVMCFVEVKFRRTDKQGGGLDYVTSAKLRQMKFAAEIWVSENDWQGDWRLMAAAVELQDGQMAVTELVETT